MKNLRCLRFLKGILFVAYLLFFTLGVSPAQEGKGEGSKIFIDHPSYDLGEIDEGSPITHTYILKNNGKEDLKIEKVQPT